MGDVVVGHGEDWDLCHRAAASLDHAGPLVNRREIGIEIAGISLPAGDFPFGSGEFPQRLGVSGHIGENDENVHVQIEGEVFRRGQSAAGGEDPFDNRIAGEVQEHGYPAEDAAILKGAAEVIGHVVGHAHGGEHDGKVRAAFVRDLGLAGDLGGQLIMAHARAGENRQLLAPDQGHHTVDGGDAGFDVVAGIHPGDRIDGGAVDIPPDDGEELPQPVRGTARAVEDPAEQLGGKRHFHRMALQPGTGIGQGEAVGPLEHLDDHPVALHLHDTAGAFGAIFQTDEDRFFKGGVSDTVEGNQGPVDLLDADIIDDHRLHPFEWKCGANITPAGRRAGPRRSGRYPQCRRRGDPADRSGHRT